MGYFSNKSVARQAFAEYLKKVGWYNEMNSNPNSALNSKSQKAKSAPKDVNCDMRDLASMCMLFFDIDSLPEEDKKGSFQTGLEIMADAFRSGDMEKKKPYLDMMYDFVESFNPDNIDFNDPKQAYKALAWLSIGQAIGTKLNENQEYFDDRYINTDEKKKKWRNILLKDSVYTNQLGFALNKLKIELPTTMTLPKVDPIYKNVDEACDKMKLRDIREYEAEQNGQTFDEIYEFSLGKEFKKFVDKDDAFFARKSNDFSPTDHRVFSPSVAISKFYSSFLTPMSFDYRYKDRVGIHDDSLIFINGKPLTQIVREKFEENNLPPKTSSFYPRCEYELTRALLDPHCHIEIGRLSPNGDDVDIKFVPVKRDLDKVNSQNRHHSWIRRAFAWIVPIHPTSNEILAQTMAEAKANEAERHAQQRQHFLNNEIRQHREFNEKCKALALKERRVNESSQLRQAVFKKGFSVVKPINVKAHSQEELQAIYNKACPNNSTSEKIKFITKVMRLESSRLINEDDVDFFSDKALSAFFVLGDNQATIKAFTEALQLRNNAMKDFFKDLVAKAYELHEDMKGKPLSAEHINEAIKACENNEHLLYIRNFDSFKNRMTLLHANDALTETFPEIDRASSEEIAEFLKNGSEEIALNTEVLQGAFDRAYAQHGDMTYEEAEKEGIEAITDVFGEEEVDYVNIIGNCIGGQEYKVDNLQQLRDINNLVKELDKEYSKDPNNAGLQQLHNIAPIFKDMYNIYEYTGMCDKDGNIIHSNEMPISNERTWLLGHVVYSCANILLETSHSLFEDEKDERKNDLANQLIEKIDPKIKNVVDNAINYENSNRIKLDLDEEFKDLSPRVSDIQKEDVKEKDISRDSMDDIVRFKD